MDKIYQFSVRSEGFLHWYIVKAVSFDEAMAYFKREMPNLTIEKVELLQDTEII